MVHYIENRLIKARKRFSLIASNNRIINEKMHPIVRTQTSLLVRKSPSRDQLIRVCDSRDDLLSEIKLYKTELTTLNKE
jgi:hypothetical protein